jgi:hypothetical protein
MLTKDKSLKLLDLSSKSETLLKEDVEIFWVESKTLDGCVYFTFNQKNGIEVNFKF